MSSQDQSPTTPFAQKYEESRQRQLFKDKCWNVIKNKWTDVREDYSTHWNGPNAEDFQEEKKIVREHVEVFEHGVVMALVVFASLRLTAHPKFEVVAEKYIKPFFRVTPPKKKTTNPQQPSNNNNKNKLKSPRLAQSDAPRGMRGKSYLEKQRDSHVEKIHQMAEAPHDFMVGTICGLSAIFLFMRPKQWRLDFEEAPLCPGRSLWSEHMCDDFIKIMQETDPKVFDFEDKDKVDANVRSFQKFALHCQLRAAYIQKRKEQGVEKPLVLPTSGPWEEED